MGRNLSRRKFTTDLLHASAAIITAPALVRKSVAAPAIISGSRALISHGVASGDVSYDSATVWSRCDRSARMVVEWSTTESFRNPRRVIGPMTGEKNDFTAKVDLANLPAGQRIFYRVRFEDPGEKG